MYDLNSSVIDEAEKARKSGNIGRVCSLLNRPILINIEHLSGAIDSFSGDDQKLYLSGLCVLFDATFSAMKRSRTPGDMLAWAEDAVYILKNYYENEKIKEIASTYKTDVNGNPFFFDKEMERQKIRWQIFIAELFKPCVWTIDAEYDRLLSLIQPGSLKHLVFYERKLAAFNKDWGDPSQIFQAAQIAWRSAADNEQNYERCAAVACSYLGFTLKLGGFGFLGQREALRYWWFSVKSDSQHLAIAMFLPKQIAKAFLEPFRNAQLKRWTDTGKIKLSYFE